MKIGMSLGMRGQRGLTQIQRAIAFLRSLGTSAHVWLPGASGVSVASLPSNNYLLSDGSTGYSTVDAVVGLVKDAMDPVTGINLTQATTANKPLVRRGLYNFLLQSATLTNASWVKVGSVAVAPVVTGSDNKIVYPAVSVGYSIAYQLLSLTAGADTVAVKLRGDVGGEVVYLSWTPNGATYNRIQCTLTTAMQTFVLPITATTGNNYIQIGVDLRDASQSAQAAQTIYVENTLVAPGTWTAAQILAEGGIPTTTATAASNSSAGKYWWSFDGSNDSLLSGNLGITNACTIVIAGRVNSLAAINYLFGEAANGVGVYINTNGSVGFGKVGNADMVVASAGTIVAGVPFVLTARLSAGTAAIRKNGAQSATAASALTFSAVTGARIGTAFDGVSFPVNGAIGWVVPIAAALSDADCLTVERLVGQQFPGMATF